MKHVINEVRGHIWSFLDAMIAESSLDTVGLRTFCSSRFGFGSRVLNPADQKSDKKILNVSRGGLVVGWEHWLRNNVFLGLPANCLCFIMFLFWSSHVYLLAENLARKSRSKMTSLGPTARVKCEALQAWDESGSGRLTVAGVASVCRLSLWWQSSDATKRTNQSSQKGRRMVLVWSEESSYTLLVQESSYVPLQRFRW